ncbi:MAG: saccharopine dehydrogenase NADP-binding domain-containing protein [Parvibaculum sp.]|uniref:saccharopine dehydrogenase NADP-binding domain-containing protein n=1 Tax=Parvibaculum sp. TaxID=2024848 RepID=UPI003C783CD4
MKTRLLIYGVEEFAGALISRRAAGAAFAHIAAGGDIARVATHANAMSRARAGLVEPRIFGLGDKSRLATQLDDVAVLVNCSPRFSKTSPALIDACLATGTHYLDICSERLNLSQVLARNDEAERAGIVLIAGTSFDVAAADAMSARLATLLPAARNLTIAVHRSPLSRAEAGSLIAACRVPGETLKNGRLTTSSPANSSVDVDFYNGEETAFLAPWRCEGISAQHRGPFTTVNSYEVLHPALTRLLKRAGIRRWMFRHGYRLAALERRIAGRRAGPTDKQLSRSRSIVWGEARAPDGSVRRARLEAPAAHLYTADATLLISRILLSGNVAPGFRWPSEVGGAALVEEIDGVTWRELADPSETMTPDLPVQVVAST